MTKSHLLAAIAASFLVVGMTVSHAQGQQPSSSQYRPPAAAQPRPTSPFALLNVARVFKEYKHFLALKNELEVQVKEADEWVKKERDRIKGLTEVLKTRNAGTPDYKQLEQQIAGAIGNLTAQVKLQQKQFLETEAKIHDTIYKEVQYEVSRFARTNGYLAVFQFSSFESDAPNSSPNPKDILQKINGSVIWHAPNADITSPVLQSLNSRFEARRPVSQNKTGVNR